MAKRTPQASVFRRILFFSVHGGWDGNGATLPLDHRGGTARDRCPLFYTGDRYWQDGPQTFAAWVDAMGDVPRLRFAVVRRLDSPEIELRGN